MEKIVVEVDEDLKELIPTFLKNRDNDIISMRKELTNKNFSAIRITGHSMKGSGGGYGFNEISLIGADIETAAEANNHDEIVALISKLESYLLSIDIKYS